MNTDSINEAINLYQMASIPCKFHIQHADNKKDAVHPNSSLKKLLIIHSEL